MEHVTLYFECHSVRQETEHQVQVAIPNRLNERFISHSIIIYFNNGKGKLLMRVITFKEMKTHGEHEI
jgi:hypothetical protein